MLEQKRTKNEESVQYSQNIMNIVQSFRGGIDMTITTTELKNNQSKYLALSSREDVIVTKNGRPIAKIVGVRQAEVASIESLFGILPSDIDEKEILKERALSL